MERKKKKLSVDYQQKTDGTEQAIIQQLFSKKFVYSQHTDWSLKSTSVFGPVSNQSATGHSSEDHCLDVEDSKLKTISFLKPDKIVGEENSTGILKAVQQKEPRIEQCVQEEKACQGVSKLCPEPEKGCGTLPAWHMPFSSHSLQLKSPRHSEGKPVSSEHPSKFRRKSTPKVQQLKRVKVVLPSPWNCDTLLDVKDKLNTLKDRLSDKEMIAWHQHTNYTNLAGKVVGETKSCFNAELCTQAWCKFHEILASHDVVPTTVFSETQSRLNSIHLCEAPGAFITSLNHYLVSRGFDTKRRWRWLGTTLNPYYEGNDTGQMISDDRFIRYSISNWFFGRDNSGDLMLEDNMLELMEWADFMGDIHLITADGSIDCQENPAEQEVIVSRLHHCEVLSSCLLLAPGGTLVIKLFTMLEASSIALLFFLNCAFEKVTVCKPATSKSGNSEVYTVCSGYTAPLSHDALFSVFSAVCAAEDPHIVLLPQEDIPEDFLAEHINCCLYFCKLQSDTISQNLELYGKMNEAEKKRMAHLKDLCVEHYVSVCALQNIDNEERIRPLGYKSHFSRFSNCRSNYSHPSKLPHSDKPPVTGYGSSAMSLPLGRLQGTFQQRQQQNQFPWQQLLAQIQDYGVDEHCSLTIKCRRELTESEVRDWRVKLGREFGAVASSHFCDSRLLGDLQLMLQRAQVKFHQQKALAQHSVTTLSEAFHLLHTTMFFRRHHHHHQTTTNFSSYHLPLDHSVTAFWQADSPELSVFTHRRLNAVEDLQQLEGEGPVGLVVDVTFPQWLGEEEVRCQARLLDLMLHVCSYLQSGSTLVLILPVALTRLSAGLLYIFASLFEETSFGASSESMFLHQTLVFYNLSYPDYTLLHLLETLRHAFAAAHQSPIHKVLFSDTATTAVADASVSVDSSAGRCVPRSSDNASCHMTVDSVVSVDSKRSLSLDGSCVSCHKCDDSVTSADSGRYLSFDGSCASCRKNASHDAEKSDVRNYEKVEFGAADRPKDSEDFSGTTVVMNVCPNNTDDPRRMSHDDSSELCQTEVKSCAARDTERNRQMSDDNVVFSVHCDSRHNSWNKPSDYRLSSDNNDKTSCREDVTSDKPISKVTQMSHGSDKMPCHKDTVLQGYSGDASTGHSSDNFSCGTASEANSMEGKNLTESAESDGASRTLQSRNGQQAAAQTHNHSFTPGSSHSSKQTELGKSWEACSSKDLGSMGVNSQRTKRTRHACGSSESWSTVLSDESASSRCQQQGENTGDGCDVSGVGGSERAENKTSVTQVPLEIVPVLEIINDVTFTKFLQASNRHSISKFLATVKTAEQQLLSTHQQ